jgi:hypothetical protein
VAVPGGFEDRSSGIGGFLRFLRFGTVDDDDDEEDMVLSCVGGGREEEESSKRITSY